VKCFADACSRQKGALVDSSDVSAEEADEDEDKQEDEDLEPETNEEEFGPDDGEDGVDDLTAQFGYDEL
jgi:hypothetical protein